MNFYKHHIGDYAQATGHLTFVEDAAYSRLIRKYYAEERPIPADLKAAQRLVGARTREEKEAVRAVLEEFFYLNDDGWHSKRCDEELAKANAQAETNKRIAEEREARRRAAREAAAPKPDGARTEHDSLHEPCSGTEHESCASREPSQTPDTRHQTPDKSFNSSQASGVVTPTEAGRACRLMREAGCTHTNPSHPELLAALAEGCTPEELGHTAREAVELGKAKPFAWAIATARSRRAEGARPPTAGEPHGNQPSRARGESAVERVERRNREAGFPSR